MSAPDETGPAAPPPPPDDADREMAPGGPGAISRGCLCSVLANAAYRSRAEAHPFVDPECPVHARRDPSTAAAG